MASQAMTMPSPESRSNPGAIMSTAVPVNTARICAGVSVGCAAHTRAATEAAAGADAEVP